MIVRQSRLFTEQIEIDPNAGQSDEWFTPRHVIEAARLVLGGIDLDPASCATAQEVVQAGAYYTKEQDGLSLPWFGRVWLNPPFSSPALSLFCTRAMDAYAAREIDAAIILMLANVDLGVRWLQRLTKMTPFAIMRSGIGFWHPDKDKALSPGRGVFVFYLGPDIARFTDVFSAFGVVKV